MCAVGYGEIPILGFYNGNKGFDANPEGRIMKKKSSIGTHQSAIVLALTLIGGVANAAFVNIGNAGNADDTVGAGYGGVDYTYKISSTEVTIAEFQAATGAGDGYENYWNTGTRTVGTGAPASYVTLYEARKYCNWLSTGNVNSGYYGTGGNNMSALSHIEYATANGKTYFVPTEDEWYKAAYWTGLGYSDYANGDDVADGAPIQGDAGGWNYDYALSSPNYTRDATLGATEQNETINMMGNVYEWMEDPAGIIRGGSFNYYETNLRSSYRGEYTPSSEWNSIGFRVVEVVPEPATALSLMLGGVVVAGYRRIRKSYGL